MLKVKYEDGNERLGDVPRLAELKKNNESISGASLRATLECRHVLCTQFSISNHSLGRRLCGGNTIGGWRSLTRRVRSHFSSWKAYDSRASETPNRRLNQDRGSFEDGTVTCR